MPPGPIGVDLDLLLDMIKKVTNALDAYPDPERISKTSGPSGSIANNFDSPLRAGARKVAANSESLRKELVSLDSAIRATLKDFTAQDEAVEDGSKKFLAILDDAKSDSERAASRTKPVSTKPGNATSAPGGNRFS